MILALTCHICDKLQPDINVDPDDFKRWMSGELIQRAFPYLTSDEREMCISQTCPTCWDRMFGDEE